MAEAGCRMQDWESLSKDVTQGKEELRDAVSWLWAELCFIQTSWEHSFVWMSLRDKHGDSEQPL